MMPDTLEFAAVPDFPLFFCGEGGAQAEEYLTISETAARLGIAPKTVQNKMSCGIFKRGVHYFSPPGLGPRFKWSAVVAWLEQPDASPAKTDADAIPMSRGYALGQPKTVH